MIDFNNNTFNEVKSKAKQFAKDAGRDLKWAARDLGHVAQLEGIDLAVAGCDKVSQGALATVELCQKAKHKLINRILARQ